MLPALLYTINRKTLPNDTRIESKSRITPFLVLFITLPKHIIPGFHHLFVYRPPYSTA